MKNNRSEALFERDWEKTADEICRFITDQVSCQRAGCLNLTEQLTGLFVPFGDSAADIVPLLPLYNSEVRGLGRHLGVPQNVIDREPTPDLLPGIFDETALGITYTKLDLLLHALQEGESDEAIAARAGTDKDTVKRITKLTALANRLNRPVPAPDLCS